MAKGIFCGSVLNFRGPVENWVLVMILMLKVMMMMMMMMMMTMMVFLMTEGLCVCVAV